MKSENGITLTSLIVYITVFMIIIGMMTYISKFFFSNVNTVKDVPKYTAEFNKFNMFFINDVKSNRTVDVNYNTIEFKDGTKYTIVDDKIYRDDLKIAQEINNVTFTVYEEIVNNTTKHILRVNMSMGEDNIFSKEIDYVLKYW